MTERSCGECTLCCKVMGVPELKKAPAQWCSSCDRGKGCTVYETRPPSCQNFRCFWLMNDNFPDEFRPDRIGALASFNDTPDSVVLHTDPARPKALRKPETRALIEALQNTYAKVFVVNGKESALLQR